MEVFLLFVFYAMGWALFFGFVCLYNKIQFRIHASKKKKEFMIKLQELHTKLSEVRKYFSKSKAVPEVGQCAISEKTDKIFQYIAIISAHLMKDDVRLSERQIGRFESLFYFCFSKLDISYYHSDWPCWWTMSCDLDNFLTRFGDICYVMEIETPDLTFDRLSHLAIKYEHICCDDYVLRPDYTVPSDF